MQSVTVLLTLLVAVVMVNSFRHQNPHHGSLKKVLYAIVTETHEKIEPTIFSQDLYALLGISPHSTAREIKKAYLSIVAKSHPDRNKSLDALYIFRNATHAYKILANEKTKNEYDIKYKTRQCIDAIENFGIDVVKPIVEEIVVPLLKVSLRSAGSTATLAYKVLLRGDNIMKPMVLDMLVPLLKLSIKSMRSNLWVSNQGFGVPSKRVTTQDKIKDAPITSSARPKLKKSWAIGARYLEHLQARKESARVSQG